MDAKTHLTGSYMVARPEKASLFDVFRFLSTGDAAATNAWGCRGSAKVQAAQRRWLIAASLVLQKALRLVKWPAFWTGITLERTANLFSDGKGICEVASDLLHGRLPDPKSVEYRSLVSLLDGRVDLDPNIKPGDPRYIASLCAMASKLAYENPARITNVVCNHWNMEFLEYFNCNNDYQDELSTQAFMFADGRLIVVAFRGTEAFNTDDWSVDVDVSWHEVPGVGKVHAGFMKALGLQRPGWWPEEPPSGRKQYAYYAIRDRLRGVLRDHPNAGVVLTGHSLGGALAAVFPLVLALHEEEGVLERVAGVYTFGQPRVGDERLGEFMSGLLDGEGQRYFRFVYNNDMVPRLPFDDGTFLFKHWGRCLYYDAGYDGQVMEEEPARNYFSLADAGRKRVSAARELARSFWIGWTKGAEYREGWAQTAARVAGVLVSPGLADHGLQDYVNCTRLGTCLHL